MILFTYCAILKEMFGANAFCVEFLKWCICVMVIVAYLFDFLKTLEWFSVANNSHA